MSYKVFIASRSYSRYSPQTKQFLQENDCQLDYNQLDRVYKEEDLLEIVDDYDVIVVGVDEVTERVIKKSDRLKVIAKNGVGVDNIDLEAADEAGVYVVNAPGTNSQSVADLAIGLMLSLARSIPVVDRMTKNGHWKRRLGRELWDKTVGIVGTGDIGQRVAHIAHKGFNCEILAYDIEKDSQFANRYDVSYVGLDNLLQDSDFISLHIPLNKHTKNLIDKRELELMKQSAYLINTARGGVINEQALYQALKEEEIAGAACDAFAEEPPGDSKLFELDNFIATAHIGAYTYETNDRTGIKLARNLVQALRGEQPATLVNNP